MKIGLAGTVSVGKTTLVDALKLFPQFENYYFATERSKYLKNLGIPLNTDSTTRGQIIFMAERSSELFRDNIITDRSIIDVMAFTSLSKSISNEYKGYLNQCASTLIKEYDHIFYISTLGVELEDNGVRTIDPFYRDQLDSEIKFLLRAFPPKNLHIIEGKTVPERVRFILERTGLINV